MSNAAVGTSFTEFLDKANQVYNSSTSAQPEKASADAQNMSSAEAARRTPESPRTGTPEQTATGGDDASARVSKEDRAPGQTAPDENSTAKRASSGPSEIRTDKADSRNSGSSHIALAGNTAEDNSRIPADTKSQQQMGKTQTAKTGPDKTENSAKQKNTGRAVSLNSNLSTLRASLEKVQTAAGKNGAVQLTQDQSSSVPGAKKTAVQQKPVAGSGDGEKNRSIRKENKSEKAAQTQKADASSSSAVLAMAGIAASRKNAPGSSVASSAGSKEENTIQKTSARKKDGLPEIKVTDLRGSLNSAAVQSAKAGTEEKAGSGAGHSGHGNETELEFNLDAGLKTADAKGKSQSTAAGQVSTRSFSEALAARFEQNWNDQIVQNAHVILRNGDAGTIRLHLKPESLGGVKIELKLADNSISGKIIVESDEAKTAFERDMASLNDAFKQGGFDSAKLEVSVGSQNQGGGQSQNKAADPFWSERRRLDYDAGPGIAAQSGLTGPAVRSGINILA